MGFTEACEHISHWCPWVGVLIAPTWTAMIAMDCWAHRAPSGTISDTIQRVGMTSNHHHIKTWGPFVDREGKGHTLTRSGGTSPRWARGLPPTLWAARRLCSGNCICITCIVGVLISLRYLFLWTQWFCRFTFSTKHLLGGKVLRVLQDTGPSNGLQQVSDPSTARKDGPSQGTDVVQRKESLRVTLFCKHTKTF